MKCLYLDESGDCSFATSSMYKHFLITILSLDPEDRGLLKAKLKRVFADFIRHGWNQAREIKACDLYRDRKFGGDAVRKVIDNLAQIVSLQISYIVVNKNQILNDSFRNADYGIAYNFFAGVLVSELVYDDGLRDIDLVYDIRNKETHNKKHFSEYLKTIVFGKAVTDETDVSLLIRGMNSHESYGLLANDFFCWSVFREFEHGDNSFSARFAHKFLRRRQWYTKK